MHLVSYRSPCRCPNLSNGGYKIHPCAGSYETVTKLLDLDKTILAPPSNPRQIPLRGALCGYFGAPCLALFIAPYYCRYRLTQ